MFGVGWQIEEPLITSLEIAINLQVRQHPPRAFTSQLAYIFAYSHRCLRERYVS